MSLVVEVVGIDHRNKGAVLMLEAVIERLRAEFPDARIAVPLTVPADQRLRRGLYASMPRDGGRRDLSDLTHFLPGRVRRAVGFFAPRDIDVRLDASGFAYGDYWGPYKLQRRLLAPLKKWKRAGKTAVLLPQALGPFRTVGMGAAFNEALSRLDIAYVRDRQSLVHVEEAASKRDNARLAPDFTNLLSPELPPRLADLRGKGLVIPNEKVASPNDASRRTAYVDFLALALNALARSGVEPVLLIHEGEGDRALAREVNARLDKPAPIIDEPSALVTKAVIGAASLVVSSRFHGLVSALSSGVPAMAAGWSHKYDELMRAYGCTNFVIDLDDRPSWTPRLEALLQAADSTELKTRLSTAAEHERQRSRAMWDEICALLRARNHG